MKDANPTPSKIEPNTFQTPNLLTDEGLLALLTGSETKCYLVVVRKTFGWRKKRDRIAKSQIVAMTGLSDDTVDDCMASLVAYRLVLRTAENNPANEGVEWELQTDDRAIDYEGLRVRLESSKRSNSKRTEKARLARGGVVPHPPLVQQPQGGVVPHPPQQPITTNVLVVVNAAAIFQNYESEFGGLTAMIADAINDDIETYSAEWVFEAMQIAVLANKRSWNYVQGILKRCKEKNVRPSLNRLENQNGNNGSGNSKSAKTSRPQKANAPAYTDADRAAAERVKKRIQPAVSAV